MLLTQLEVIIDFFVKPIYINYTYNMHIRISSVKLHEDRHDNRIKTGWTFIHFNFQFKGYLLSLEIPEQTHTIKNMYHN